MWTPKLLSDAIHSRREIALPESLGACATWGDGECTFAAAVIEALLLEPTEELRRLHNQYILLAAEIDRIEPLDEIQAAELLRAPNLRTRLSLEISMLSERSGATLGRKLAFDVSKPVRKPKTKGSTGKYHGIAIREILTVGLTVKVMHREAVKGSKAFTPEAAMQLIFTEGKTNTMFLKSDREVRNAFTRYKSVAHLSAALLDHIYQHDLNCFRVEQRKAWYSHIVEFLQHAAFYEDFIVNTLPAKRPRILRAEFDLVQLPPWLDVTPSQPALLEDIGEFVRRGDQEPRRKKAN
jgi:hypothetical protein